MHGFWPGWKNVVQYFYFSKIPANLFSGPAVDVRHLNFWYKETKCLGGMNLLALGAYAERLINAELLLVTFVFMDRSNF